ncbi:MAG: GNAT family N-acetyltransferase [Oscillibacter sp.]|nr:GNAT family N-acetyltransferase [Oscillibacter sp.]
MTELRLASPEQVAMVYERDLRSAFPPAELKPLANIQDMCREGCYQPWCLFDGEEIVGECFLWLGHPGWDLLDYLCVTESHRNGGEGARMLELLRRTKPESVILIESEAPCHAPDPGLAERRLGFYARCGCRTAGYDTDVFGAHYKILYLWPSSLPDERLMEENRFIYQNRFSQEKYNRYVRIPRDPAASPMAQVPWNED